MLNNQGEESFGGANNNSTPQQQNNYGTQPAFQEGRNSAVRRGRSMDPNQRSRAKAAKSSTPSRLGLDMISDWEVEEDRISQGSPASARQPVDPELAPNFVPVHPSHRGTFYKRKAKKKKKKKKRIVEDHTIPKGVHGFYAQRKPEDPPEEEEYGVEWANPTGGSRNVRNSSPQSFDGSNSGRANQMNAQMKRYEGYESFAQQQQREQQARQAEREAAEKADQARLGKQRKAKSAMILASADGAGRIDEDDEYSSPNKQKTFMAGSKKKDKSALHIELQDMKNMKGRAYDELASDQQSQGSKTSKTITARKGKVKHNKPQKKPKNKSGATAAATADGEEEEEEEDDATSGADDATSQDGLDEIEIDTKSVHERRKLGRRKYDKGGEESEKDDKKRKSMKNKFDYDALDKLAEYERQEKIANGELPPDEEVLIHPDEDILFDQEDGHVAAALSYKKVKDNQWFYHCFDRQKSTRFKKVPIDWYNTSISYIPCCKKTIKKSMWVTPTAVEIGLGPTLFLMTMKAFFWMFVLFSILNIPLILLYCGQGVTEVKEGVEEGAKSSGLNDFFAKFSLGNLGTSAFDCANVNVGLNEKLLRFSCKHGRLQEFFEFGLQKIDNQSCSDAIGTFIGENDSWNDLQVDCNFDNGMTTHGKSQLYESFNDYCQGEAYCDMPIKYSWFNADCRNRLNFYAEGSKYDYYAKEIRGWKTWEYDQRRREPVIFGVAFCVADEINVPFTPDPFPFQKHQFTYFILAVDFFTVFFMICFINLLETRYEEYAEIFDKRNVEMRDFTLEFNNLPLDHEFGGKELMLQAQMWNFMEKHVKEAIMASAKEDPELEEQYEEEKQWEVMDVNFITSNWAEIDMLTEMDGLDRDKKTKIGALQKQQAAAKAKAPADDDKEGGADDEASEAIIEVIQKFKKIKGEYIDIQEEKLYEKWTLSSEKKRTVTTQTFSTCFVTFKSMLGKDRAEQLFKFAKDDKRANAADKMFYDRWLLVSNPIAFSSYIGSHIRLSACSRYTRSFIIWLLAGAIIAAALIGMVMFADYNYSLTAAASMNEACQPDIATDIAYEDFLKPLKQRQGLLHCYCLDVYNLNGGNVQPAFAQFKEVDADLVKNPCDDWKFSYDFAFYLTIISGAMIGLLNTICVAIFEQVPILFEGCLTYQCQTKAQFHRIIIIQFLNIGVVLLFADFNLGTVSSAGIPILAGRYRDFDTDWYFGVGSKICFAMISNSIAPFFGELFQPIVKGLLRYASRNFKWHLLKKTNVLKEREKQRLKDEEAQIGAGGKQEGDEAGGEDTGKKGKKGEDGEDEEEDEEGEGGSRSSKLNQSVEYAPETYRSGSPLKKSRKANQGYEGGEISFQADGGDDEAEEESAGLAEPGEIEPEGAEDGEEPGDEEEEFGEDEPECEGAFGISIALGHLFQDDLNDFYVNPDIKTFYWYAWFFTNLLIYLMYGGSMPLMYPLGIIFFILNFYCEKLLFCRFYRKTFEFDESLPFHAVRLMKYAVFIHLLMNCFMFTDKRLMTPKDYTTELHYRPKLEAPERFFERRYDDLHSRSVVYLFIVLVVLYCFYRTCIQPCCNLCKKCGERKKAFNLQDKQIATSGKDKDAVAALIAEDFSDDIVKELNIRFLRTLYIRCHKEYELFRTMVNAISYDQEKLSDEDALQFKRRLKQRVRHVEDTIDVHLNLIGGLEKYMDRTYIYKLAVLEENEEKIPMKDKKSQRLTDLIQSYNIMDCLDFAKPKLIQNRIDREMLELEYMQKAEQPVYC